jgi:hypothetical protein
VEDRAIRYLESRGIVKDSKRNEILIVVRRDGNGGKRLSRDSLQLSSKMPIEYKLIWQ